ncbi:DJ-1 family glyoxalase III [Acetobacterium bakii]|uniref:Thiamine biosynthesis protein ThiJ n=1 Tax=Acetobacterium bakii TaxID=52689 RepID=A0A0L6TV61_9FIRM|nr:DJ-1 family glyoxalase III [Acetobacterium bakii]KNZ40161.1 thiamine biosynthesis protein ThiJ [Acetobacterium bakii]
MNVIVFLADGFEEVEALTVVDYLRRVKPITVDMIAIGDGLMVTGSHHITVKADRHIDDLAKLDAYEAVIIPGGMPGAANLRDDPRVIKIIREMNDAGQLVAAICAGPIVLEKAAIVAGKKMTSFPSFEKEFPHSSYQAEAVVRDGNIITSRGPGTAVDFALEIVTVLVGEEEAETLRKNILYHKKK